MRPLYSSTIENRVPAPDGHRLGLGVPTRAVRNQLLNSIPSALAEEADRLSGWFLHDPDSASGSHIPHGEVRRLSLSIQRRRRVELTIGRQPTLTVSPLGLVLKAGSWYLVVAEEGGTGVVQLDQLRGTRLTTQPLVLPLGFNLAEFWGGHLESATA